MTFLQQAQIIQQICMCCKAVIAADDGHPTWLPNSQRCGFQTGAFQPLSDCLASNLRQESLDSSTRVHAPEAAIRRREQNHITQLMR